MVHHLPNIPNPQRRRREEIVHSQGLTIGLHHGCVTFGLPETQFTHLRNGTTTIAYKRESVRVKFANTCGWVKNEVGWAQWSLSPGLCLSHAR